MRQQADGEGAHGRRGRTGPRARDKRRGSPVEHLSLPDPSVITSLDADPRRSSRVVISLNGTVAGSVPVDLLAEHGLARGLEVEGRALEGLIESMRRTVILDKALDLLAVRSRSRRDLGLRLRRIEATAEQVEWVLDRLAAQGLIDDAQYARQVARHRMVSGGVSRRRIETELRRRGVAADVAVEAIDDMADEVELDEYPAALEAARRRLRSQGGLDPATRRRRLYGFLARRGYESAVVQRVLKEVLARPGDDDG